MDLMELLLNRRSIRKYKPDMVPEEILEKIIEVGTYAATGRGLQSPIIIAVTDKKMRDRLSALNASIMGTDADPFYGAPVVLIVLADKSVRTYLYPLATPIRSAGEYSPEKSIGTTMLEK